MNLEHLNPAQAILESLSYVYDAAGNRASMERVSMPVKLPNPASNITYNQANQMLTFTPSTGSAKNMTYDNNGNMTSVTNSCGTTTYDWDVRNRLVGISGFDAQCSLLSANFKYDALGRRIQKTITHTGTDTDTMYLYDGFDIIQEIENGVVSVNYIRTLNIDEPLARIKSNGTVRYYQTDALGSIIALSDEAGTIRTQYTYDPYGNVTITSEASDNPFQYTGRENDGTGLYYYRFRYYSPELQRFISEDQMGLAGGINLYTYVQNDPVNSVDQLGLCASGVYFVSGVEYGGFLFFVGVKSAHLKFTCIGDSKDTFTATLTSLSIGGGLGGGIGTPAGVVKGCNRKEAITNITGFGGSVTIYPAPLGLPSKPGFGSSVFWSSSFKAGGLTPGFGLEVSGGGSYTFEW